MTCHIRPHPHLHASCPLVVVHHIHEMVCGVVVSGQIGDDTPLQSLLHIILILHQSKQLHQLRLRRHIFGVETVHQTDVWHFLQCDGCHRIKQFLDGTIFLAHFWFRCCLGLNLYGFGQNRGKGSTKKSHHHKIRHFFSLFNLNVASSWHFTQQMRWLMIRDLFVWQSALPSGWAPPPGSDVLQWQFLRVSLKLVWEM